MLQKRGHLWVLIHWALHRKEAATQFVNQAHAHHVAGCRGEMHVAIQYGLHHVHIHDEPYHTQTWTPPTSRHHTILSKASHYFYNFSLLLVILIASFKKKKENDHLIIIPGLKSLTVGETIYIVPIHS